MKKIREIFRLYYKCGIESHREIAKALRVSRPVVKDYLISFKKSGLAYNDLETMPDDSLLEKLSGPRKAKEKYRILAKQFEYFAKELKRTGVTLYRLWEEYKADQIDFYSYSQFCYHFQIWRNSSRLTMVMGHKAGDKMFIDFAGKKLQITNWLTQEKTDVEVFVAVLGASQMTYVEATETQQKKDWITANENAFHFFGGVPKASVPDNLKSAINKACHYEPDVNPEYFAFAKHYNIVILPARARKPQDKSLAENGVKIVYMWIYAALRNEVFYSLEELNTAIRDELEKYNSKPMQILKKSRLELFNEIEKSELKPLPKEKYEYKHYARVSTRFNYHIYLKELGIYFSVPYRYRKKEVEVLYTNKTVEIYLKNTRIAFHKIDYSKRYNTLPEHMPADHRWVAEWSPERIIKWANAIGSPTGELIKEILNRSSYPEQGYKVCFGILGLGKKFNNQRLNNACKKAMSFRLFTYRGVNNILTNGIDRLPIEQKLLFEKTLPEHENIRGKKYYEEETINE